jgi:hypothetical protein
MKSRFLFGLIAALAMVFSAHGLASADQPEILKFDVCHKDGRSGNYSLAPVNVHSVEDAQNVGGHGSHEGDSWEGYTYGGVDYPGQGDMGNCNEPPPYETCDQTTAVPGTWSDWEIDSNDESQLVRSRTITYVDAEDGETVCDEETEYGYMDRPVCEWNSELYADDPECQPPSGEASASLTPFCGGGIQVNLANAKITVDGAEISSSGSYALDLGDYVASAEADDGFEFPEGATTQWEFTIGRCSTPDREPPTGPEDALPIAGFAAFLGLLGIAGANMRTLIKRIA